MSNVRLPESYPLPRKPPQEKPSLPDPGDENVRYEFWASPDFFRRVDAARKLRGISRAAYIRQAALLLASEDLKDISDAD